MSILQILSEEDDFTLLESYDRSNLKVQFCALCFKEISGPAYFLDDEDERSFGLHKACAEKPGEIEQHPLHDHPNHTLVIEYTFFRSNLSVKICDGCRHYSPTIMFRCKECKFKLDFDCIYSLDHDHEGRQPLNKERAEKLTFYHPHTLQLFYIPSLLPEKYNIRCCCCQKYINDSAYTCFLCGDDIVIHESCSDTIPKQFKSLLHPQHILRCFTARDFRWTTCGGCKADVYGVILGCKSCDKSFHISCAMRSRRSFKVSAHDHNLFYTDYYAEDYDCNECKESCDGSSAICRCMECDKEFHIKCVLPGEFNHECHHHTLTLTNSYVPKYNHSNEYLCDICEKQGDTGLYVYHCEECDFVTHIECLFSEENPQLDDLEQHIDTVQETEIKDDQKINHEFDEISEVDNESNEINGGDNDEENENIGTKQQRELQNLVMKLDKDIKKLDEDIEKLTLKLGRLKDERASILMLLN